jgi:hypothetical protein
MLRVPQFLGRGMIKLTSGSLGGGPNLIETQKASEVTTEANVQQLISSLPKHRVKAVAAL